jgi:hypothetical protein
MPVANQSTELTALYLLPRGSSLALALGRVREAAPALAGLAAARAWGGLLHITLTSFSAEPRHERELPVAGDAVAAAGTAAAGRDEPWNIDAGRWVRRQGRSGKEFWEIDRECRVLKAVMRVVGRTEGVVGARTVGSGRKGKMALHVTFGNEGKEVRYSDMARFLGMLEWDLALVSRTAGDERGMERMRTLG